MKKGDDRIEKLIMRLNGVKENTFYPELLNILTIMRVFMQGLHQCDETLK